MRVLDGRSPSNTLISCPISWPFQMNHNLIRPYPKIQEEFAF